VPAAVERKHPVHPLHSQRCVAGRAVVLDRYQPHRPGGPASPAQAKPAATHRRAGCTDSPGNLAGPGLAMPMWLTTERSWRAMLDLFDEAFG
jgi:hypothetical protein